MLEVRPFRADDERFQAIVGRADAQNDAVETAVAEIVADIRRRQDAALFDWTERLDGPRLDAATVRVTDAEIAAAQREVADDFLTAAALARSNIRRFHEYQKRSGYIHDDGDGVRLAKRVTPLATVGVYCPGGTAPLVSTLLMNVVPAQVAGVGRIVMATPPRKDGTIDPHLLAAARLLAVDEIYKIGGAQAVAALAYGTESVPRVDKIVGPGNAYVVAAKRRVFGAVGIDGLAGPSEIVIIADDSAPARYLAADLLSQVEHGSGYEAGVVFTDNRDVAEAVRIEVGRQLDKLERKETAVASLSRFGAVFLCDHLLEAVDASNLIAPEHLEIVTRNAVELAREVDNAGAIFLGPWSPEPVGDYFAGTNHVLPTGGAARFSSSLGVADFVKDISIIEYSAERLARTGRHIAKLAETEGLTAHARAVTVRLDDL